MAEYFSLDTDYLDFLNVQLRDLRGYRTLANELIQNADDAENATKIIIDVRDDALIIENDGIFTDCGALNQSECPWLSNSDYGHRCDFHRFRKTASGDKRREDNTAGAFGVGFISVYQITDQPELQSRNRHWIIRLLESTEKRIFAPDDPQFYSGTRFYLPWAFEESELRIRLGVEAVQHHIVDKFIEEVAPHMASAILFLKRIKRIELKKNGGLIKVVTLKKIPNEKKLLVKEKPGKTSSWKLTQNDFQDEGERLKAEASGKIEEKRKTDVIIALPLSKDKIKGLFYAYLPTEHPTELPFHINADFFPYSDRRRVDLGNDYQGRWNKAAIHAAAKALANILPDLPSIMGHKGTWEIIQSAWNVYGNSAIDQPEEIRKSFWDSILSIISETPIVYTSTGQWVRPDSDNQEPHLLLGKNEVKALPVIEACQLTIVHPELIPFNNLLRKIGIQSLGVTKLAEALRLNGLKDPIAIEDAPPWARSSGSRNLLGDEIEIILGRQGESGQARKEAENDLRQCAIAFTSDRYLSPPVLVRRLPEEKQHLFKEIAPEAYFLGPNNHEAIAKLVPDFSIDDAIQLIFDLPTEEMTEFWKKSPEVYIELLSWISKQRENLTSHHKKILSDIKIWPSGEKLKSLDQVVIPGDFEDPLSLAELIDGRVLKACGYFLMKELNAKQLTVANYAIQFIPQALNKTDEPPASVCNRLVELFAINIGKLRNESQAQKVLSRCPMIECSDGKIREAREIYFSSDLVNGILGEIAPIANLPNDNSEVVREFLRWLGVVDIPKPFDIINIIKTITNTHPSLESKKQIQSIFATIGKNWLNFKGKMEDLFDLQDLKWLPAEGNNSEWHKPDELFAKYQKHLFYTQAKFLDVDIGDQRKSNEFISFLKINTAPKPIHVIQHLIKCSEDNLEISRDIYRYLNEKFEDSKILELKGRKCLLLDNDKWVAPNEVFWGDHPFGKYRVKLGEDWRVYTPLLQKLEVRENSTPEDAIEVLKDISKEFGVQNKILDDETYSIVIRCWKQLSMAINQGWDPNALMQLEEIKSVPDTRKLLSEPGLIFFEDRPLLAQKLSPVIENNVIQRPDEAWIAMESAGVRQLSQATQVNLLEASNTRPQKLVADKIKNRKNQILRVLSSIADAQWNRELLDEIDYQQVDCLRIQYKLNFLNKVLSSEPEDLSSYFDKSSKILYVKAGDPPWAAISRELAYALNPMAEIGSVAPGLKEVLNAPSNEQADWALDELGYAPLLIVENCEVSCGIAGIGGQEFTENDEDIIPPASQENFEKGKDKQNDASENKDENDEKLKEPTPKDTKEKKDRKKETTGKRTDQTSSKGRNKTIKNKPIKQGGRLRSYVINQPDGNLNEDPGKNDDRNKEIDQAGMDLVIEFEKTAGRIPKAMPVNHPGYDIESQDNSADDIRYIEVKSMAGIWGLQGVGLTETQYKQAQKHSDKYWLYVAEQVETSEAKITRIQNPANKVDEYRFDDGWRQCAENDGEADHLQSHRKSIFDLPNEDLQDEIEKD